MASSRRYIFSSESVGEGHPDKVCDTISDAVLDACLKQDKNSRVACETYAKSNMVIVGGEITTHGWIDFARIVREAVREIGYVNDDDIFHADKIFITNFLTEQSQDIAQGVDEAAAEGKKPRRAGRRRPGHHVRLRLQRNARADAGADHVCAPPRPRADPHPQERPASAWLRPDAKSQVSVIYDGGKPVGISNVVISTQHSEDVKHSEIRDFLIAEVIRKVLPAELLTNDTEFLINPTGRFVIGGPQGDTGLTGRKIIVDTYGGMGRHGGGAFSGKDPSKVDRSAAYMGRWVAKNVVAAGLADRLRSPVRLRDRPSRSGVSVHIDTFGTGDRR